MKAERTKHKSKKHRSLARVSNSTISTLSDQTDGSSGAALQDDVEMENDSLSSSDDYDLSEPLIDGNSDSSEFPSNEVTDQPTACDFAGGAPANVMKGPMLIKEVDPLTDFRLGARQFQCSATLHLHKAEQHTFNRFSLSNDERRRINNAVTAFIIQHRVPREDIAILVNRRLNKANEAGYGDDKYKKFVNDVKEQSGVNRSLSQILWYLKRKYSRNRTNGAKWTKEEDEELLRLVKMKGPKWPEIERDMGKTDAHKRFAKISPEKFGASVKGRWTKRDEETITAAILEYMRDNNITDWREFNAWTIVAQKVNKLPESCSSKWQTMKRQQLQANRPFSDDDRKSLLERLRRLCSTAEDDTEVIWNSIVCTSEPWSGVFLRTEWRTMKAKVPEKELDGFLCLQDLVEYIQDNFDELSNKPAEPKRDAPPSVAEKTVGAERTKKGEIVIQSHLSEMYVTSSDEEEQLPSHGPNNGSLSVPPSQTTRKQCSVDTAEFRQPCKNRVSTHNEKKRSKKVMEITNRKYLQKRQKLNKKYDEKGMPKAMKSHKAKKHEL